MAKLDVSGGRFGRLVAQESTGEKRWGVYLWRCVCDCGNTTVAAVNSLRSGLVRSCGCLASERAKKKATTHGQYGSPAYKSWDSMLQRCTNPNVVGYERYGGAGITVCDRWRKFENFLADMGHRPKGTTLDRYPGQQGNYEPGNCRWATLQQQRMNQSRGTMSLDQVQQIRDERAATGDGPRPISQRLGLSESAVGAVLYGRSFAPRVKAS